MSRKLSWKEKIAKKSMGTPRLDRCLASLKRNFMEAARALENREKK